MSTSCLPKILALSPAVMSCMVARLSSSTPLKVVSKLVDPFSDQVYGS